MKTISLFAVLGALTCANAQTFSPARPPAIPLAAKSPYLSTHLTVGSDGGNGGLLAADYTRYWQNDVASWVGLVRVDGTTYAWMGNADALGFPAVTQEAFTYTATRSIFTMNTPEGVGLNITFLTPVYPNDWKRHSQTASYLNVDVWSADGAPHDVQIYGDISAEWASNIESAIVEWEFQDEAGLFTHNVHRRDQLLFTEDQPNNGGVAQWGNAIWSTTSGPGVSWQSGADVDVRKEFGDNGALVNEGDPDFRAVSDRWPVFGLVHDLGSISNDGASAVFAVGFYQQEGIQFQGTEGVVSLPSYWTNFWSSPEEAIAEFIGEYDFTADAMTDVDNKIHNEAVALGGQDYAAIVELAYRQTYASLVIAGTEDRHYVFLKEISSIGNIQTVDVMFPAFPAYLYDNPDLVKGLLDPLFENQEAGWYPNTWAMHDLGASFPNATGHGDGNDERMSVEEPGNMLIMTLAYVQKSGNTDYLTQHYDILKQWNAYLVNAALRPVEPDNLSTDDFAGQHDLQTDLALKGIIGIGAMAEIARLVGNTEDADNFQSIAEDYISQWQDLGVNSDANPPHATFAYDEPDSHGLLYNLYADKLLKLNLVPESVYTMQSDFYPTVGGEYGVALDTRWGWTKLDWEMWCAAYSSRETQDYFYSRIVKFINDTPTNAPLTDLYNVEGAGFADDTNAEGEHRRIVFAFRAVVGGAFAQLALQ